MTSQVVKGKGLSVPTPTLACLLPALLQGPVTPHLFRRPEGPTPGLLEADHEGPKFLGEISSPEPVTEGIWPKFPS